MYSRLRLLAGIWLGTAALACGGGGTTGAGDDDPDASPPAADASIPAPDRTWTWFSVQDTQCMDGSPTGMGVNLNPGSNKLMIYLEGGGACFNQFTCSGVAHQNGFVERDLEAFDRDYGSAGVFNRDDDDNPFKDWNFVFIPYCTGDIFAGNNPTGALGRNQVGYVNMGLYVDALLWAFPGTSNVVLTGSSAGGFGAAYNFDRVQKAFGDTPVTLLDDSGPPLSDDYLTPCLQTQVRDLWNLDATLPEDCTDCRKEGGGGLVNFTTYLAEKYTDHQFGIVSSTRDGVIRLFYGWGYPDCDSPQVPMAEEPFAEGIAQLRDEVLAPYDNMKLYTIESAYHVWLLEDELGSVSSGGVKLTDWIRGLLRGGDDWDDVAP